MDNLFQLPCEFQYHLIIPSMLTGLQVVWEAYGTPVLITIIVADRASLRAVHVGRRHEFDVAQLEDARDDPEHVEYLPPAHPDVLKSFLKFSSPHQIDLSYPNTKFKTEQDKTCRFTPILSFLSSESIELTLVIRKSTLSSKLASEDMLREDEEDDVMPLPPPPPPVVPRA